MRTRHLASLALLAVGLAYPAPAAAHRLDEYLQASRISVDPDRVTIEIDSANVPLISGALELASAGLLTGADKTNREYVGEEVSVAATVDPNLLKLFFDPQTAGGLLLSISEDKADDLLTELRRNYPRAEIIGRVTERGAKAIVVK